MYWILVFLCIFGIVFILLLWWNKTKGNKPKDWRSYYHGTGEKR
jgi:hypothetical protein